MAHDHHHHHDHDHSHGHHHAPADFSRAFAIGIALNLGFVAIEAVAGVAVNSLALMADAGHNLSDVLGLALAWGATWLGRRPASRRRTYGFGRGTILASLVNAVVLLIGIGAIAWEAVLRLGHPEPVEGGMVMAVAGIGIVINTGTALLFMGGRDLNIRGAFWHMAGDAAVSAGVVLAALVMGRTGWLWLDPAASLAISAVIAVGTWGLLRDSLDLSLDAVPGGVDRQAVEDYLAGLPGVRSLHDLHIWPLSTSSVALTAHLVMPEGAADDVTLHRLADTLHDRFGIDHATIQVERGDGGEVCRLVEVHAVPGAA